MKHLFEALWLIAGFVIMALVYYGIKSRVKSRRRKRLEEKRRYQQEVAKTKWRRAQISAAYQRLCRDEISWFEVRQSGQPQGRIQISRAPGKPVVLIEVPPFKLSEQDRKSLAELGAFSFRALPDAFQMEFKADAFGFDRLVERLMQVLCGKDVPLTLEIKE